jgi:hypothetical protein
VSVDPRFERTVLAHGDRDELLAHLRRVVVAVPRRFRPVAWLHHAHEADVTPRGSSTAGLTTDELSALERLAS